MNTPRRIASPLPLAHSPLLTTLLTALLAACSVTQPPARPGSPPPTPRAAPPASVDARRQAEFDRSQDRWHGASVKELIGKLGQPTLKAQQPDGRPVYVYAKSTKLNGPTGPVDFRCVVRYVLDDRGERVTGHTIEGC